MGVRAFMYFLLSAVVLAEPTQHDAIPVLLQRCVMCHGQTLKDGGVDLRTKSSMLASKAIVPGKPEASPMITRILSHQRILHQKIWHFNYTQSTCLSLCDARYKRNR